MMKSSPLQEIFSRSVVLVVGMILLLTGCARTAPVAYYQLSAVKDGHDVPGSTEISGAVIGIGPVRVPEYLDRPQILTRNGVNQVRLSEGHRWIEPLTENISRVIGENIHTLAGNKRLLLYPWNREISVDYQVVVDLVHFDGEGYRQGHLEALWSILDSGGNIVLPQQRSDYTVATTSPDHGGLVQALSEALFLFCRDIVQQMSLQHGRQI